MIFRKIALFFIILSLFQVSWAQTEKPSVGVLKLESSGLPEYKSIKINKYIESAFYKSNRFNIVTRQLQEAIRQERELQKENIDAIVIQQGRAIGADYIVKGEARGYQQSVTKSSPKSRGPSRSSTRAASKSSPRTSTKKETDTTTDKKPAKTTKLKKKTSTTDNSSSPRTTKTSETDSKESSTKLSSSKSGTKKQVSGKSSNKSSLKKTSKKKPATSPKKETETQKKEEKPAPLSAEVDRIYTNTRINFSIEILDVKTGVILKQKTYNGSINRLSYFVQQFLRETFPYDFQIVEIMEMKSKKKAKNLLVYGGSNHGLGIGSTLRVYEVLEEEVDGQILEREVKVGKLFVNRLETGGNFSLCSITKGKKTLLAKIQKGAKLVCR